MATRALRFLGLAELASYLLRFSRRLGGNDCSDSKGLLGFRV